MKKNNILDEEPEPPHEDDLEKLLAPEEPTRGRTYEDWIRPIEVDKALLTPESTSKKIVITMPKYEDKTVAIALTTPDGKPILTDEGKVLYRAENHSVFVGYGAEEIELPGQEVFNIDLNSTFLNEGDIAAIRTGQALYADMQLQTLKGKDRNEDMHYVYTRIMSVVATAKARDGRTAELAKTTITKGTSEQAIIQRYKEEEKKKLWGFGGKE